MVRTRLLPLFLVVLLVLPSMVLAAPWDINIGQAVGDFFGGVANAVKGAVDWAVQNPETVILGLVAIGLIATGVGAVAGIGILGTVGSAAFVASSVVSAANLGYMAYTGQPISALDVALTAASFIPAGAVVKGGGSFAKGLSGMKAFARFGEAAEESTPAFAKAVSKLVSNEGKYAVYVEKEMNAWGLKGSKFGLVNWKLDAPAFSQSSTKSVFLNLRDAPFAAKNDFNLLTHEVVHVATDSSPKFADRFFNGASNAAKFFTRTNTEPFGGFNEKFVDWTASMSKPGYSNWLISQGKYGTAGTLTHDVIQTASSISKSWGNQLIKEASQFKGTLPAIIGGGVTTIKSTPAPVSFAPVKPAPKPVINCTCSAPVKPAPAPVKSAPSGGKH